MEFSISCPFADDVDENVESFIVRAISFKNESVKKRVRSFSFNGRGSETKILKSFVSFRRRDFDPLNLETMVSIKAPSLSMSKESAFVSASFKGIETGNQLPAASSTLTDRNSNIPTSELGSPKHEAAVKLQKVYKSFRTRRQLADCAVLVEQSWWELLDFAELKRKSVSFFDIEKPETAFSRWSRASTRVAKVGKGLSKDEKARQLALQHWLEAIDPRHRYGHNLQFYYKNWSHCQSRQPFFYWLDIGEGKEVNLERCPRANLQQQCIKYLGPKEREAYEVVVEEGMFFFKDGRPLDTFEGDRDTKWIFVLSTSKTLYVGKKKKGMFQHSSFLAGGATSAAGRLVVENGILKAVWPHSGHYQPTKENFQEFINFLREKNVDLTNVKESSTDEDDSSVSKHGSRIATRNSPSEVDMGRKINDEATDITRPEDDFEFNQSQAFENETSSIHVQEGTATVVKSENEGQVTGGSLIESQMVHNKVLEKSSLSMTHNMLHKQNQFEKEEDGVPQESVLRRINSHKGMKSYQLGKQLSFKWTTGAGPRIGCVRDYPTELQFRALEQVNLSPRSSGNSRASSSPRTMMSPRPRH